MATEQTQTYGSLKIAISGSISTWKTTLGIALAKSLNLPFIEEGLENVFVVPKGAARDMKLRAERIMQTLEEKRKIEEASAGFVADRCPLDLLNFWFGLLVQQSVDSTEFVERCAEYLLSYDHIVLLPFGVLPVSQKSASPLSQRNLNHWPQLLGNVRIQGFARHFVPAGRIIDLPKAIVGEKERLDFVLGKVT